MSKKQQQSSRPSRPSSPEEFTFQTEVRQLLDLMIHSLYSHKEVFLRELISNSSDACDKLQFAALTDNKLKKVAGESLIEVRCDPQARTLSVSDNGIGMNRDEVIENIGTIARSGTRKFLDMMQSAKPGAGDSGSSGSSTRPADASLIGQFGVGFYSVFMVADKVELHTRKAGEAAAAGVKWTSGGGDGFTIEPLARAEHGCTVTLHLGKGEKEFLDETRLRAIIRRYSDHISIPVRMAAADGAGEAETVNKGAALWARPRKEISATDYNEFYAALSLDPQPPTAVIHNRVEGKLDYISLLFIPARAPVSLMDPEQRHGIRLYVRRIFIMDDSRHLLPRYLRFVRGIIDAADLPLNVSREFLQQNKEIDRIRAAATRKILLELKRIATKDSDKYRELWKEYGSVLKEGLVEDPDNRAALAELVRFATTAGDGEAQTVSFADYTGRMPMKQQAIYYITAETHDAAANSPHLEIFRKNNIEVLLLTDAVDEWVVAHVREYQDKPLQSVARSGIDIEGVAVADDGGAGKDAGVRGDKGDDKNLAPLLAKLKEILDGKVKEVVVSSRLTDSPACLVADEHDMGGNLKRILQTMGQELPVTPPILEINAAHPLIRQLSPDSADLADWAEILFSQAALSEGASLAQPTAYVRRVNDLLTRALLKG